MRQGVVWALTALAVVLFLGSAHAKRGPPSLVGDEYSKKFVRASECIFGGQVRELGSTWFADLGPPFGVMYCIKCECISVHKKRKIVAKAQCKNIKNECPKPSCDDPMLYPGRCCKVCPGDLYNSDTVLNQEPMVITNDEEEMDARHFAALLTGPRHPPAAIRFVLRRRSLHFAVEEGGPSIPAELRARSLQIIDSTGSTLQEVPLAAGGNLAGRDCGAWRRLPRDYRRMLREGKLSAALLWPGETEPELFGPIISHSALSTEIFSSLLEVDSRTSGWGGTAAISASAGATSSLHITVLFTGVLSSENMVDAPVKVSLEMVDKNRTILEEVCHIKKPSNEINIVELSSPVSASDLRFLARGHLSLSVRAVRTGNGATFNQPVLRGPALPKLACEMFHSPLAATPRSPPPQASGVANMYLSREGELVYAVKVDELNMLESPMLTLVDETNKRHTELENLTPFLQDGIANGSLDRMGPRLLESLYSGNLAINVATHSEGSVIRGRLFSRPIADMHDLNGPVLMKRPDLTQPADLVGLAWISVDYECNLEWEVTLAGPAASGLPMNNLELWLETRHPVGINAPITSRRLGSLDSPEGVVVSPPQIFLQRLNTGTCEIIVREPITNITLLKAMLKHMKLPTACLPQLPNNEVPTVPYLPSHPNSADNSVDSPSCFYSGSFYDDGAQWTSGTCMMCSCIQGTVSCDSVKCPPLSCDGQAMIRPGECCPMCLNTTSQDLNISSTRGCQLAGQFHPAGQPWHPYLPPEGFDTCIVCTCESRTLTVRCSRTTCPPLNCPEKLAYRPDKKACCRVCPEIKLEIPEVIDRSSLGSNGEQKDEGYKTETKQTAEDILSNGGCRYPLGGPLQNGHEWHPVLHSHGEQKCVTCRCKDGEVKCDRKRCPRSICNSQLQNLRRSRPTRGPAGHKSSPQARAPPDECCQQHCKRYRRHQRHRSVRT